MKLFLTTIFLLFELHLFSQNVFSFSGKITDGNHEAIVGAVVILYEIKKNVISDSEGFFIFENLAPGTYHLHISYLGYKCVHENEIEIADKNVFKTFAMQQENISLDEIAVTGRSDQKSRRNSAISTEIVDKDFMQKNLNINVIKSIENIAGVSSSDIGQGFSKPVIRGLGFNRVAVSENGVKQEGQQWGADHGLEIDQFGVEKIEIIKGPASLKFGSDAVGGVVKISPPNLPLKQTYSTELQSVFKSVNNLFAASLMSKIRFDNVHFYFRATHSQFGDYRVPAESFFYNRYRFAIHNKTMKNTAGKETDLYLTAGLVQNRYKTAFSVSNVYGKSGFFPGAHGIPSAEKLTDDGDSRNVDLPFQAVNHFKIINNSSFYLNNGKIESSVGYQNNFRQEWSKFHTHYQNQEVPETNPDLELEFILHTLSADIKYARQSEKHESEIGISAQHQINETAGYMFLLPEFRRTSYGIYIIDKFSPKPNLNISGGIRYDNGQIDIEEYFSVYAASYKSNRFSAHFHDFTWSLGLSYDLTSNINFKTNLGKSFRMPNASELSANGIHHGSFRYELGDRRINSEKSYQFDIGLYVHNEKGKIEISPFVNYFPNFIFLNPTGSYLLPDGSEIAEADAGQVYRYVQSEALRAGGEVLLEWNMFRNLNFRTSGEYVYASDLSYPIPFTPPLNIFSELDFTLPFTTSIFERTQFTLNSNFTFAQNRSARNELKTKDSNIYSYSLSTTVKIRKIEFIFVFTIQNLFDTKYYNHLSFYRSIEIPEPGRNFQISLEIPFQKSMK